MMKKILLSLSLLSTLGYAQNGLQNIIIEPYYISSANDTVANPDGGTLPVKSTTYRIYVDMLPGYKFQAAFGVNTPGGEHELRLSTTTMFFNNIDRGATAPTYSKSNAADNTVMLDSWLSAGAGCAGNFGVLKSADNGASTVVNAYSPKVLQDTGSWAGIPIKDEDGLMTSTVTPEAMTPVNITSEISVFDDQTVGGLFSTWNGSWASLNGSVGLDTNNIVLIAQVTTDGNFAYQLNIQIGTPLGGTEQYVAKNAVGAEILCAFCMDSLIAPNYTPTVTITSPVSGSTVTAGSIVGIIAGAGDPDGSIDSVQFYIDANYIGSDASSPYQINWTSVVGTHSITAVAYDDMNAQATSSVVTISVTTGGGSGIGDEYNSGPVINVYPNPTKDIVNIEIDVTEKSNSNHYAIYSILGDIMYRKTYRELGPLHGKQIETIDMSEFANGQYIIIFSFDGIISTQKVIKN